MAQSVSESENPAIPAPTPAQDRPQTNQDWWPNQPNLNVLHKHSPLDKPGQSSTTGRSSRAWTWRP